MNLIDATFPYPVLNPNTDDVSFNVCTYTPDVRVSNNGFAYHLSFTIDIDDPYLKALIEAGFAVYSMEVSCSSTFMIKRASSKNNVLEVDLPEGSVKGNVEITLTITAVKRIRNYCNPRAHEDYGNQSFDILPGEVLAFFGTEILPTDIKYPKLGSASSFIEIRPYESEDGLMFVDLNTSIIGICLPQSDYTAYETEIGSPDYKEILYSSIVYNALLYALLNFSNYKDKDLIWVKTIRYYLDNVDKFRELAGDPSEPMYDDEGNEITILDNPETCQKVAQYILNKPTHVLLDYLHNQTSARLAANNEEE